MPNQHYDSKSGALIFTLTESEKKDIEYKHMVKQLIQEVAELKVIIEGLELEIKLLKGARI